MIRFSMLLLVLVLAGCSPKAPVNVDKKALSNRVPLLTAELDRLDLHIISHASDSGFYRSYPERSLYSERLSKEAQLDELFRKLAGLKRVKRIALLSHGGLNAFGKSRTSARDVCKQMIVESKGEIFPIFITWRSGFFTTYGDSLFYERSGLSNKGNALRLPSSIGGALFYLPSDLMTGVARLPKTVPTAFRNVLQNWDASYRLTPSWYPVKKSYNATLGGVFANSGVSDDSRQWHEGFDNLDQELSSPRAGRVPASPWYRTSLGKATHSWEVPLTMQNIVMAPVKVATLGPVDSIARPAWENMTKRTRVLVRPDEVGKSGGSQETAISILVSRLAELKGYHKEVYGHSMGSMVFNEVVREVVEKRMPDPGFDRFVYMAAACSINDFNSSVGVYLQRNPEARFYNLCLHPDCEVRETFHPIANIAVSGSLLVWIDSFYESPRSRLDRTLGSYVNVINSWQYLPQNKNITVKAFGMQQKSKKAAGWPDSAGNYNAGPQKHGEFNDFHFWEAKYQEAKPRDRMPQYIRFRK